MFRLTPAEWQGMRSQIVTAYEPINPMASQIVTAYQTKRNTNVTPYAFTEQGVAMLSGVLNSDRAINMNIAIMRAFVEVRRVLSNFYTQNYAFLELKLNLKTHTSISKRLQFE